MSAGKEHTPARWRRDLLLSLLALALLLLWEWSRLDLTVSRLYGDASGFRWREAWLTAGLGHQGGRLVAWVIFAIWISDAIRPWIASCSPQAPACAQRRYWQAVTLLCLTVVPTLKKFSDTSCPWDLAEFGGTAAYVPHWLLGVVDGGAGRCFPSGHAIAAFAFFSLYFLWRPHRPAVARACLATVLLLGTLFGWAQLARGAHYVSHTLWSAWICWAICALAAAWKEVRSQPAAGTAAAEVAKVAEVSKEPAPSLGP